MTTEIGWTWVPDGKGGTKIGRTLNHQVGCKEISRACEKCYAAKLAHREMSQQHKGLTVMRTNAAGENLGVHWNGKINRVPKMLEQPLRWRKPSGIFVGSMTDVFFDVSTDEACRWIAALFGVMAATQQHTYMLLTKRPELAAIWFAWLDAQSAAKVERGTSPSLDHARQSIAWECARQYVDVKLLGDIRFAQGQPWPLPWVWMGVTAEDQRRADERIPILLGLPAEVRYVSYEPAVGPVDFTRWLGPSRLRDEGWDVWETFDNEPERYCDEAPLFDSEQDAREWATDQGFAHGFYVEQTDLENLHPDQIALSLDQVIIGGESGPGARPSHPDWFKSAIAQCEAAGVPAFFKQYGEHAPADQHPDVEWSCAVDRDGKVYGRTTSSPLDWPRGADGMPDVAIMCKVGKAVAGRTINGRTYEGFPKVPHV